MKKLFLASFAVFTLPHLRRLLSRPPEELSVAFIPTAADPYSDQAFVEKDRQAFRDMGFSLTNIDLKNYTEDTLRTTLVPFDVICVAGGNTYYLLDKVRKSGFDTVAQEMIDRGVVYVGSSAGSVLAGPTIDIARRFDPPEIVPELTDYSGLNLVDFLILPHFGKEKYLDRMQQALEEWQNKGYAVQTLSDNQVVIVDGDTTTVVETD